jgi:pimeloyl-ACP methyl ester carboxylesterase
MDFDGCIPKSYEYFNSHKITYIEYCVRRKNYYYVSYDCDTLVIIHGLGSSPDIIWSKVISTLSQYFRILILDVFGYGYSNKTFINTTIEFFLDYLLGVLEKLPVDRCAVIGHSLGGYLATEFAIRFFTSRL